MSAIDRATNKAHIDNDITTSGVGSITGALLNTILNNLADSYANIVSDLSNLRLREYDPSQTYSIGFATVFEGGLYQANESAITGVFNASKWTLIVKIEDPNAYDFVPYVNVDTYNIGDRVLYLSKFFICDVNGTVGVIPVDTAPEWSEVSANLNSEAPAPEWIAGYYLNEQVVRYNNVLYYLDVATPPSYNSTDIVAEIGAGDWKLFNNHSELTGAVIKTLLFNEADTNNLTDVLLSKLNGIEANATADQTASEIKALLNIVEQTETTTDATPTIIAGSKAVGSNSSLTFDIIVHAVQTAGASGTVGDTMKRRYTGTITNVGGTTVFEDTFNEIIESESLGSEGYAVSISADDTGDELDITVTGQASKTIKWFVTSKFNEITW